ncbi:MAG: beta strand repeat-containing protein [Desulfuromonadaceae bacterium]
MTKVVITGEGDLSSNLTDSVAGGAANTKLATVDASVATGDLNLTLGVALDQTITSGSGDDTLTFGNTLTKDDVVDGGEGDDSLISTGNLKESSYSKVTNIENVTMIMNGGNGNTTNTLNAGAFTGLDKVTVQLEAGLKTNADDATVSGLAAGTEVVVQDMSDIVAAGSDGTVDDVTVNGANVSGSADELDFTLNAKRSGTDFTVDNLFANGYETINIESTGALAANANIENIITNGITDTSIKSLVISGDREFILGGTTAATTVDASAMTAGGVTIGLGAANQEVTGSDFNDTFSIAYGNLTDKDTIAGGDGTDTLDLSNAGGAMSFAGSTNAAKLENVSGFEKLGMSTAADSIVLDDISMGAFTDDTVNITIGGDISGNAVDVSNVKSSNASINVDSTKITTAGNAFNFIISNGNDGLTGGAGVDTVVVTDEVYISASDSLNGGSGNNNVLAFNDQGAVATNTFAASQFAGVSNFDTWAITDTAGVANAETFDITIDNDAAAANAHSTTSILTLGIDQTDANAVANDTLKLDASEVGASVKLDVAGGANADTIKLGAGNDTVFGGAGADSITLGGGKNTVVMTDETDGAANSGIQHAMDTIIGFNFGAAAGKTDANIDKLNLKALDDFTDLVGYGGAFGWGGGSFDTVQVVTGSATATLAGTDVLVLAHQGFQDAAAVDVYLEANNDGNVDDDLIVAYQDTLGNVRVAFADGDNGSVESAGADYVTTDIASLSGVTIAGVQDNIDVGDFVVA